MRVAMISEHANPMAVLGSEDAGGQNVYVDEVSRQVAAHGFEVDVFTRRESSGQPECVEWAPGVRVVHVLAGPPEYLKKDLLLPYMPAFVDEVLRFAAASGTRYDLIHGNFWMSGWVGAQLKRAWGVPFVQIFHALGAIKRLHQGEADTSPPERIAIEREVLLAADRVIAQCPSEVTELQVHYDADPSRVQVIPSAVNTSTFRPMGQSSARRALGWPASELAILYVGRLLPRKGIDNVIRALPLLAERLRSPFRLHVVGGETFEADLRREPEMRRLRDIAVDLGVLDRVQFVGKRAGHDLFRYYSAADVFVSTPWYEPYGLTPLEAMACATPAIVAYVGGMQFTVRDGETGFHVEPNDPPGLADRLATLLGDATLRQRMGRAARQRVTSHFTWAEVARRVALLYRELLDVPATDVAVQAPPAEPARDRRSARRPSAPVVVEGAG